MAATATQTRAWQAGSAIRSTGTIVLSGSYTSGGDPLTLPKPGTMKAPYFVNVLGKAGYIYQYDFENAKLIVRTGAAAQAALTELTAGAYIAALTGDVIRYIADWPRLG
jgi:hypothetical protein